VRLGLVPGLAALSRVRGHTFLDLGLDSGSVLIDAGAHRGEFSRVLFDRYGCRCFLVEPDPGLSADLKGKGFGVTIAGALGGKDGRAAFFVRTNPEASGLLTRLSAGAPRTVIEVDVIALPTLLQVQAIDEVALLKLDIEGSEFDVLMDMPGETLARIAQISVEFHGFVDAPSERFRAVRRRLAGFGFVCCPIAFRAHGDVLFLNRHRFDIGMAATAGLPAASRFVIKSREIVGWMSARR